MTKKTSLSQAINERTKAKEQGKETYLGKPCKKCNIREKSVKHGRCISCHSKTTRDRNERRRKPNGRGPYKKKEPPIVAVLPDKELFFRKDKIYTGPVGERLAYQRIQGVL